MNTETAPIHHYPPVTRAVESIHSGPREGCKKPECKQECLPGCPSIKEWIDSLKVYGEQPAKHVVGCPNEYDICPYCYGQEGPYKIGEEPEGWFGANVCRKHGEILRSHLNIHPATDEEIEEMIDGHTSYCVHPNGPSPECADTDVFSLIARIKEQQKTLNELKDVLETLFIISTNKEQRGQIRGALKRYWK